MKKLFDPKEVAKSLNYELKFLFSYVRDENNQKIGVVAAADRYNIGWSVVKKTSNDKFDPVLGLKIALGRAIKASTVVSPNEKVQEAMEKMRYRARDYFQVNPQ